MITTYLAQEGAVPLLPLVAFVLKLLDLCCTSLEFSLSHTQLLLRRLQLARHLLQLRLEGLRPFRMGFAVRPKRRVALAENGQLVDALNKFRMLGLRCCRLNRTFTFLPWS